MRYLFTSILIVLLIMFIAYPVRSENLLPYMPSCLEQDYLIIENDGPQKAIVTYSNSIESCSPNVEMIITAPNGIAVHIELIVMDAETIILTPVDPNFMSFPPEATIDDGAPAVKFLISGGMM